MDPADPPAPLKHLDVCLVWRGLLSPVGSCPTNNSVWICAAKLHSNSEAAFSSFHLDFAQEIPAIGLQEGLARGGGARHRPASLPRRGVRASSDGAVPDVSPPPSVETQNAPVYGGVC